MPLCLPSSFVILFIYYSSAGSSLLHGLFCSCGSWTLEHMLHISGAQAQPPRGMWDPPRTGTEPTSPAYVGSFIVSHPPSLTS